MSQNDVGDRINNSCCTIQSAFTSLTVVAQMPNQQFSIGSIINLPEVSSAIGIDNSKFEILEKHEGGMGVCLKLRCGKAPDTFSLKCIQPYWLGDYNSIIRFRDELKVWITSSACDGVAEALSLVRINELLSVIAIWIEGHDLAHSIPQLSPSVKFEIIVRTVRTLNWVQTNLGVIHRDIKPSNILLDRNRLSFICDWGLARPVKSSLARAINVPENKKFTRPDRTQHGSFLGTALYAAPEQFEDASSVDHRADIYALGCVMFELETGTPPFDGICVPELYQQHRYNSPPKLGGLFSRTSLGLDKIIARCLSKQPSDRYQTYKELEKDLLRVAKEKGFSLERCTIHERYKRYQLGKGHLKHREVMKNAEFKGRGVVLLELDDIAPFLKEASDLMTLGRYVEAEILLRPTYLPEAINSGDDWCVHHLNAAQYAYCLLYIKDRLPESLKIFASLATAKNAPAEYFINYALAMLRASKFKEARQICERGLTFYPDDIDLLGNYTIALLWCKEIDDAWKIASRRLEMRRDVHSLQEAASVLATKRDILRNLDLPEAIKCAKLEHRLIVEAKSLNPWFGEICIARIQLLQFSNSTMKAVEECKAIMDNIQWHSEWRQFAFGEYISIITERNDYDFDSTLEVIENNIDPKLMPSVKRSLQAARIKVLANYMIGRIDDETGARVIIKEVMDHVLGNPEERALDVVTVSRVLEWIGYLSEAENVLRDGINNPDDSYLARLQLVSLLANQKRYKEAMVQADRLVEQGPWCALSYDTMSALAEMMGNHQLAKSAKQKGDVIYQKELKLFSELRAVIE